MKRLHLHVGVGNLERSIAFYNALFDAKPSVIEADYAKWLLDDPLLNFAISTRSASGVDHVGLQAGDEAEFDALRSRLAAADLALTDQEDVVCCYARSGKTWTRDPDGLAWESFVTRGPATVYAESAPDAVPEPTPGSERAVEPAVGGCGSAPAACC